MIPRRAMFGAALSATAVAAAGRSSAALAKGAVGYSGRTVRIIVPYSLSGAVR